MSFFGGGTDVPTFFNEHGGAVISTTFDKYSYIIVRHMPPFHNYLSELVYSKIERVNDVNDIVHPSIREAMKWLDMHEIRLTYEGDLPARTGLGTSSTFAVGMLNAFYALKGRHVSDKQLAKDAIYLERVLCKESGGWQDQIAAAFGGLNRIDFKNNEFKVSPIVIDQQRKTLLDKSLLLFYTGITRFSADVQKDTMSKQNLADKTAQLKEMLSLVDEAQVVLENPHTSLNEFGRLLDYTWKLKRQSGSKISNAGIDTLYARGIEAGALGGKLLGAGGGGFLLFYCEPDKQEHLKKALDDLMQVPFNFESDGTNIIYYDPAIYNPRKKFEYLLNK